MKEGLALVALAASSLQACLPVEKGNAAPIDDAIIVGAPPGQFLSASDTRWSIEVWNGPSITGDPKDNGYFLPDADTILLGIVRDCKLGSTYRNQHTDGVLMLAIKNTNLTAEQRRCIRSKERRGLRLVDNEPKK